MFLMRLIRDDYHILATTTAPSGVSKLFASLQLHVVSHPVSVDSTTAPSISRRTSTNAGRALPRGSTFVLRFGLISQV